MTLATHSRPASPDAPALAWRILALLNLYRLLIPPVLLALLFLLERAVVGQNGPRLFAAVSTAYFLFAAMSITGIKKHWPALRTQALLHVGVDIAAVALLTFTSGGMASGIAILAVLPIGAASLLLERRLALLLAAAATLALLGQQLAVNVTWGTEPGDFTSAGTTGAIMFALALAAGPLMRRLRESEALVRQRDVDLANLAELNDFIVQHLRESILVVDPEDRIRLINESAARQLKGSAVVPGTLLGEVSPRLLYLLDTWRRDHHDWQVTTLSLVSADGSSLIQPHFVALQAGNPGPTLIFLEDTSVIADRVQQSKLAALGRLSASIAHEIRNPVGAMSHAAQLLRESADLGPQEQRLTQIISENGARVSTIIENVLQLSRRDTTKPERLRLGEWLRDFLDEFHETLQVDAARIGLAVPEEELEVRIDPSHLHQIAWNLCENAVKYGQSDTTAPIEVRIGRIVATERPFLEIADRGPGIDPVDVERIFEPFFTAGPGGTGLGLFIARELAQCNRAVLLYEPRNGGGSIFRLVFADPQRWEA